MWRPIEQAPHHELILCSTEEMLNEGYMFLCRWHGKEPGSYDTAGFYFRSNGMNIMFTDPTMFQYLN